MNKLEEISAFMDGESGLSSESVIASMQHDTELRGVWRRYHLVGDSLRGQLPAELPATDLATRISSALESEPAILSPQKHQQSLTRRMLKPAAGMAIAASVALVAIVGLRGLDQTTSSGGIGADMVATSNAGTGPSPMEGEAPMQSLQPAAPSQLARTVSSTDSQSVQGDYQQSGSQYRFNSYLINHNEYRANSGVRGTMPYARIVAPYGSDQ